jgi:excisionase family DNA binding protein
MGDPALLLDVLAGHPLLPTPEEAAALLRICRTTNYALMKAGDLRPVHIGRSCRLPRAELERYIRCLGSASQTAPTPTGNCRAPRLSGPQMGATRRGPSSQ